MKLCECGCSLPAPIATKTDRHQGWVKGHPKRFISGHNRANLKHGQAVKGNSTPEYRSYRSAQNRCVNRCNDAFPCYGGRGIQFRFTSFEQFYAELGPRPVGTSLDRINNDGHYEVGNVRWATASEQRNNQRRMLKAA